MVIVSNEDKFTYDVEASNKENKNYKVNLINKTNNHEQVILKNDDAVYVVTPSLNKSYKFVSEWPYNSSQSYILNSLVKDLDEDDDIKFEEREKEYALIVDVNYPNNDNLEYEVLLFDKKKNLKSVLIYDDQDVVAIKVVFNKIDFKANLSESDFSVDKMIKDNCCNSEVTEPTEDTSILDDIVYPLYVPANTYLKNRETVNTENGERVILTFNGEKNFVLIEEMSNVNEEFEIIPIYGEPLMLSNTIGALGTNSLTWSNNNMDYYLTSNDLTTSEILSIADSLSVANIIEEK
jgi:outer membrane lipoprotein-sorting protein